MTLESPGVIELDTSVVPNVLYENAELTRVLPGRAQNSACVLVPDARATPRGFHDVTLVDMTSGYDRCDRSDSLDGRDAQLAMTVAHISVDGDDTMTDRPVNEAGVQEPVSRSSSREMHILWTKHYA